mmetsp:Transcript_81297/g.119048  ORF Transcript_81297/g.119048 Transcript_81297/m.119048 type:complete len:226 (-) Transcript_81297:2364-3041(-)
MALLLRRRFDGVVSSSPPRRVLLELLLGLRTRLLPVLRDPAPFITSPSSSSSSSPPSLSPFPAPTLLLPRLSLTGLFSEACVEVLRGRPRNFFLGVSSSGSSSSSLYTAPFDAALPEGVTALSALSPRPPAFEPRPLLFLPRAAGSSSSTPPPPVSKPTPSPSTTATVLLCSTKIPSAASSFSMGTINLLQAKTSAAVPLHSGHSQHQCPLFLNRSSVSPAQKVW